MHLRFKDFFFFWSPVSPKVVRIFTSSTFTDMLMERNTLMEYVYPKIKEYCREKHGLEYQVSVSLCLFLRTLDVMLMSVSLKFQQLLCFNTLGGGHALGCERRDDWWAHDDGKDFGSIEQCSGVSPYLILICTRLFVWMNCEAVRSTPWAQISSILGLKSRNPVHYIQRKGDFDVYCLPKVRLQTDTIRDWYCRTGPPQVIFAIMVKTCTNNFLGKHLSAWEMTFTFLTNGTLWQMIFLYSSITFHLVSRCLGCKHDIT